MRNVAKIYFFEQIDGRGIKASFYSSIEEILQQKMKDNPYISKIPKNTMDSAIKNWLFTEDQKPSSITISDKSKLLFVYTVKNSTGFSLHILPQKLDFSFAVPKKRLKNNLKIGNFSDLGNVVIVPKYDGYKEKTYYEYTYEDNPVLKTLLYPSIEELMPFVDSFGKSEYRSFRMSRRKYLIDLFKRAYYGDDVDEIENLSLSDD